MDHLSDTDIALMAAGAGTPELRQSLAGHLAACEDCAERVAACVILSRPAEDPLDAPGASGGPASNAPRASEATTGPAPDPTPAEFAHRMREAFREAAQSHGWVAPRDRTLRLIPWQDLWQGSRQSTPGHAAGPASPPRGNEPPLPLAAQAQRSGAPEELPVLVTEDGQLRVRFRRPRSGGPLHAYLIAPSSWSAGGVSIQLPGRCLSFRLDAEGTTALPGVGAKDLRSGNLVIRLEPGD